MYKKIFIFLFKRLKLKGTLELMHDGSTYFFGSGVGAKIKIEVIDDDFFRRIILYTDTGFGESYFLGFFKTRDIKETLLWFEENKDYLPDFRHSNYLFYLFGAARFISRISHSLRKNTKKGSLKNIHEHYDVSNDFYRLWLDNSMTYSAAVFEGKMTLEEAQANKYKKICEDIGLTEFDRLLEIGSGWGGFSLFAVKNYNCNITTVTISEEQFKYVKELVKKEKLESKIKIIFSDYRDLDGQYDKLVSIEMMEALGHEYVPRFIEKCRELLKSGGKMGLQFISYPEKYFKHYLKNQNYIKKHIFPGGELLSLERVKNTIKETGELKDYKERHIGLDYAKTLNDWARNFQDKKEEIIKLGFDERFFRKWYFYFVFCEVGFETGYLDDVQLFVRKS